MDAKKTETISLKLFSDISLLPLATSFVENGSKVFGLSSKDSLSLALATEEIFAYLCRVTQVPFNLEILAQKGGYYVKVDFLLPIEDFNMRIFNIASSISLEDEQGLEELGLFIASRKVDRFQLSELSPGGIILSLIKEKSYPETDNLRIPEPEEAESYSIKRPSPEELKLFVVITDSNYPKLLIPKSFRYPGKVVDMFLSGHYDAALAYGETGSIVGGIVWQWSGPKTVEFFGPYVFSKSFSKDISQDLLDSCISSIAKSPVVALINRLPTDELPKEQFELLGALDIVKDDNSIVSLPTYFRQMQEDTGSYVWIDPAIEKFLRSEYGRLVLPREIRIVKDLGEEKERYSVLSTDFDRSLNMVILRPIRSGKDSMDNIRNHINLFQRESIRSVFFEMDLAHPWQVSFTEGLLKNNFSPKLILPYAGDSDILVFQWGNRGS